MLATLRDGSRAGAFVAATWLIGLGLVILAQQWLDLSWAEAWPLFVILVGVGSLASVFVSWRGVRLDLSGGVGSIRVQ